MCNMGHAQFNMQVHLKLAAVFQSTELQTNNLGILLLLDYGAITLGPSWQKFGKLGYLGPKSTISSCCRVSGALLAFYWRFIAEVFRIIPELFPSFCELLPRCPVV